MLSVTRCLRKTEIERGKMSIRRRYAEWILFKMYVRPLKASVRACSDRLNIAVLPVSSAETQAHVAPLLAGLVYLAGVHLTHIVWPSFLSDRFVACPRTLAPPVRLFAKTMGNIAFPLSI